MPAIQSRMVFEFLVGPGTDLDRKRRSDECLVELNKVTTEAQRHSWANGFAGPGSPVDVINWITRNPLASVPLDIVRPSGDLSPRYCVIYDGPVEIIVCYYDLALAHRDGRPFEASLNGVKCPIVLRFALPMGWAIQNQTFTLLQL